MTKDIQAVIFDLDGTLLDTSEGVYAGIIETIEHFGLRKPTDEELRTYIGPPIQISFERHYGVTGEKLGEMVACFRASYKNHLFKAKPYDGIYDAFAKLRDAGIATAVATYKREDYALEVLRHFDFDQYTDVMFGSDLEGKLGKNDIIEKAIKSLGIEDYSKVVMVGDSDNDAIGATKIGTKFVGVTWGFGFGDKADVDKFDNVGCVATCDELVNLILGM